MLATKTTVLATSLPHACQPSGPCLPMLFSCFSQSIFQRLLHQRPHSMLARTTHVLATSLPRHCRPRGCACQRCSSASYRAFPKLVLLTSMLQARPQSNTPVSALSGQAVSQHVRQQWRLRRDPRQVRVQQGGPKPVQRAKKES